MVDDKPTPLTVRLGKRGEVVIPSAIRESMGLAEGDSLLLYEGDGGLRLLKVPTDPVERLRWALRNAFAGSDDPASVLREIRDEWQETSDPIVTFSQAGARYFVGTDPVTYTRELRDEGP